MIESIEAQLTKLMQSRISTIEFTVTKTESFFVDGKLQVVITSAYDTSYDPDAVLAPVLDKLDAASLGLKFTYVITDCKPMFTVIVTVTQI